MTTRKRESISQRAFVTRISGSFTSYDTAVADVPCTGAWVKAKMAGMAWGTQGRVVFTACAEAVEGHVRIAAVRVPEVR